MNPHLSYNKEQDSVVVLCILEIDSTVQPVGVGCPWREKRVSASCSIYLSYHLVFFISREIKKNNHLAHWFTRIRTIKNNDKITPYSHHTDLAVLYSKKNYCTDGHNN